MLGFSELSTPVKAILALAFVLVLVVIAGLLLRKITGGKLRLPGQGGRARQPRLGVVDIFELDRQRQLVLLRRDNVEHLVMIGGPNDVVVEASIQRAGQRAPAPPPPEPVAAPEAALVTAAPTIARAEPAIELQTPPATKPESAVVKPLVAAGAATAAVVAAATAAKATTANETPPIPRPLSEDDIAATFEAELAKAAQAEAATTTAVAPPVLAPVKSSGSASPAMPEALKPIIEPIARPADLTASPSELDDMTRQLQEALKRPFSGVKPPAAPELPPVPVVEAAAGPKDAIESAIETAAEPLPAPIAAPEPVTMVPETAKVERQPAKSIAPQNDQPVAQPALVIEPPMPASRMIDFIEEPATAADLDLERALASALAPEVAPASSTPVTAASAPEPAPAAPEPAARAEPPPASKPKVSKPKPEVQEAASQPAPAPTAAEPAGAAKDGKDPFSVESIEAEFARLLNRSATPKT